MDGEATTIPELYVVGVWMDGWMGCAYMCVCILVDLSLANFNPRGVS